MSATTGRKMYRSVFGLLMLVILLPVAYLLSLGPIVATCCKVTATGNQVAIGKLDYAIEFPMPVALLYSPAIDLIFAESAGSISMRYYDYLQWWAAKS